MGATLAGLAVPRTNTHRFHLWMAAVFVLITFGGFTPTYWAPVLGGRFHAPPIVHVPGFLLFYWTVFYFVQTAWISAGRTATHRNWGLFGIALFSVLLCSIIVTKVTSMRLDDLRGYGAASRRFGAVTFCALPLMIGLFAAAISNVRRPEVHKRWMFLLLAGMMTPAVARVFITLFAPPGAAQGAPPPPFVALPPAIVGIVLVIIAMIYDWRTRGRPRPVYGWGLALLIAEPLFATWFADTPTWMRIALSLEHLTG